MCFRFGGVRVFVDPKSFIYLHGMVLDYQETLMRQGFVFVNPNSTKLRLRYIILSLARVGGSPDRAGRVKDPTSHPMNGAGCAPAQNFAWQVQVKSSLVTHGDETASCWSCGTMRAVHFCSACGKVQPPVPVDYFTFFGFPKKLNLDTAALEREFYALSRRLHPDMYAQAENQERAWGLEQSSLLNDAYRTLKDPIKRTQYLLRLRA